MSLINIHRAKVGQKKIQMQSIPQSGEFTVTPNDFSLSSPFGADSKIPACSTELWEAPLAKIFFETSVWSSSLFSLPFIPFIFFWIGQNTQLFCLFPSLD